MNPYVAALQNYAVLRGRTSRPSYWLAVLLMYVLLLIASFADEVIGTRFRGGGGLLIDLFALANVVPFVALGVRRMHDTDHSGWWLLLPPVAFVFAVMAGTPGENRFGVAPTPPTPRARRRSAAAAASASAPRPAPPRDIVGEIERLAQLKAEGHLSEAEFAAMKAQALGGEARP